MLIAAAVAVIVVAVLVAVSVTGGDKKTSTTNLAGVDEATALFAGIPQNGLVIGNPSAKVTIEEYLDLQCPHCAAAASGTVPSLVTQFVKTGKAKLELRPTDLIGGPDSRVGARALVAAGQQGHAAEFTDILFANQGTEGDGWLGDAIITQVAQALKLDTGKFDDARNASASNGVVDTVNATMKTNSYNSTPTFVIKGPKGQYEIQNRENIAEFGQAINAVQ